MSQVVQNEASPTSARSALPLRALGWQLGLVGALTLWLYRSILFHLVGQWWQDPNFSHGFFVPLFSAFVVWQERDRLRRLPLRASWSGLPILALALCVLVVGQMGAELFLSRFSLLIALAGLTVLFLGWNFFRATLFPWAFLLLMIPIPAIIFSQITFPLQLLASGFAAETLPLFGVPILREGNVINLPSMALEIAEACSGIRSLMSLVTLAIIYGYLMEKRLWLRCLLAVASVPIAVVANSLRIIGTGLLVQYWDPDKAEGYFHASWGWIIFVVSLLLLYALHGLIGVIWPDRGAKLMARQWRAGSKLHGDRIVRGSMARFLFATLLIVGAAIFSCACLRIRTSGFPTSICSSPTSPASVLETQFTLRRTAFQELDGPPSNPAASRLRFLGRRHFQPTGMSSPREIAANSSCTGTGRMAGGLPVNTGPNTTWSPIPSR